VFPLSPLFSHSLLLLFLSLISNIFTISFQREYSRT
jgi:hypothetical protein